MAGWPTRFDDGLVQTCSRSNLSPLRRTTAVGVLVLGALLSVTVEAGSGSAVMPVMLIIRDACDVAAMRVSGASGSQTSSALSAAQASELTVRCTPGAAYSLSVYDGSHAAVAMRRVAHSDAQAQSVYHLVVDPLHTVSWTRSAEMIRPDAVRHDAVLMPELGAREFSDSRHDDRVVITVTY